MHEKLKKKGKQRKRFTFQDSGRSPQKLLVIIRPHDSDQFDGALRGQNYELTLLVSVGENL